MPKIFLLTDKISAIKEFKLLKFFNSKFDESLMATPTPLSITSIFLPLTILPSPMERPLSKTFLIFIFSNSTIEPEVSIASP